MVNHLSGDDVSVKVSYREEDMDKNIVFASSYMPFESKDTFSKETISLIEKCQKGNMKLIIGCDANAHHILWGSSNCNDRGEGLLEYIINYGLYTLNKGNEPTFVTVNRREVIDVTMCSSNCYEHIKDWRVSSDITLSDHRLICFTVTGPVRQMAVGRNPRRTNWGSYKEDLEALVMNHFSKLSSMLDLELAVDQLQQLILQSYHQNCKAARTSSPRIVPWWSKKLSNLRSICRRLFNKAKKNGDWQAYKAALTTYNKAVREAKRISWQTYCSNISSMPATARLVKLMSKDRNCGLNAIKLDNGMYAENGKEILDVMFKTHFPNSTVTSNDNFCTPLDTRTCNKERWDAARRIVTFERTLWAINSFKPFKSPGMDEIFPALLKEGADCLIPILCRIFRSSLALGHVPSAWRLTRVIYIPKPGKDNYHEAKSFRPISLTSFLLKTLEKLVDRHLREVVLASKPLSDFQFAYQPGRSTDTALYYLTLNVEKCLVSKETALAVFLDIQGAFDRVPVDTIINALTSRSVNDTVVRWIKDLLMNRLVCSTLLGESTTIRANAGCPQGGVLSPLLWCFVVDSLLDSFKDSGVNCIGYADDIVIIAKGKFPDTVSGIMANSLRKVETWCNSRGLSVNPAKTTMVAFHRGKAINFKSIKLFGQSLSCSTGVKYLGIWLDAQLNWKLHLDYCTARAKRAFWACRNAIGRTWGLNPNVTRWIFLMIVCPIVTYGAIAWWSRVRLVTVKRNLDSVQRMVCVAMSGCMRTTPTGALQLLLGFLPLHMRIEAEAIVCMKRLKSLGYWKNYSIYLNWKDFNEDIVKHPHFIMKSDSMVPRFAFVKPFSVIFPTREEWKGDPFNIKVNPSTWYTDGSKMVSGTGAGVCCPRDGTNFSYPLGSYTTVFQAEVFAILMCCNICSSRGYRNRHVNICSDSQAALLALLKVEMTSQLVWECYLSLCSLAATNRVKLYWVPGHTGVWGNELADGLARRGSETSFTGPEPVLDVSSQLCRNTAYAILRQRQYDCWLKSEGSRQAKELNSGNPSTRAKELYKLNRNSMRKAIGLLTGHSRLKRHLFLMGIAKDPYCRGCFYEEETVSHVLCECEVFSAYRFEHLGRHIVEPWEIQNIPIRSLLNFVSATGLLGD